MHNIAGQGRTVLFVSHNMAAVRSLCNKCIFIEKGRIKTAGETDTVLDQYLAENEKTSAKKLGQRIESDPDRGAGFILDRKSKDGIVTFLCGKHLVMEFDVETPRPLDQMAVGITLINMLGTPIVSMSSKVQNVPSKNGPSNRWRVHCDLGNFPLNAGTYSSNLYIGDGIRDVTKFSDAFSFHVLPNDVFGWGNELPNVNNWGPMYWAPKWDIRPQQ
jgi:lipopolysaccharide transport system ATP-binding protein